MSLPERADQTVCSTRTATVFLPFILWCPACDWRREGTRRCLARVLRGASGFPVLLRRPRAAAGGGATPEHIPCARLLMSVRPPCQAFDLHAFSGSHNSPVKWDCNLRFADKETRLAEAEGGRDSTQVTLHAGNWTPPRKCAQSVFPLAGGTP